jgi:hypothetical protein
MTAPTQLAVAASHACAIDAGKVVCWGDDVPAILANIPALNDAQLIATGATHACVLSGRGVQCWGDGVAGDLTPRELTLPTQLAVGGGDGFAFACARHLQGVACWGADNFQQTDYDGAPLHIVHRSEARIAASSEVVWSIIMDLDRYPEWNPYTVGMKSTLKVGDPMVMQVKMSDTLTIEQTRARAGPQGMLGNRHHHARVQQRRALPVVGGAARGRHALDQRRSDRGHGQSAGDGVVRRRGAERVRRGGRGAEAARGVDVSVT